MKSVNTLFLSPNLVRLPLQRVAITVASFVLLGVWFVSVTVVGISGSAFIPVDSLAEERQFVPLSAAPLAGTNEVFVQIQSAKLRSEPKFWGPGRADLKYGDRLERLKEEAAWINARTTNGVQGYVHNSVVTARKVVLSQGSFAVDPSANGSDVVMAGKGFSKEVELGLRSREPALDYGMVDELERITVNSDQIARFIHNGGLTGSKELTLALPVDEQRARREKGTGR